MSSPPVITMAAPHPFLFMLLFTFSITPLFSTGLLKHSKSKISEFKTKFIQYEHAAVYIHFADVSVQYYIQFFREKYRNYHVLRIKYTQPLYAAVFI